MAALWAGRYIPPLLCISFLWQRYGIGQAIIFLPCIVSSFFLSFFFLVLFFLA